MKLNWQKLAWHLSRMRRIIEIWRKLDSADMVFLLDRFRCEHPAEFYEVAGRERKAA
jgi:hypothetical protein